MPTPVWPSGLQQYLDANSFSYKNGETVIRSSNDVGPDKIRRRSTRGIDTLQGSIVITVAEYSILFQFYDVDTNGGAVPFEVSHPITGATVEARFTGAPDYRSIGGGKFAVGLAWEILG